MSRIDQRRETLRAPIAISTSKPSTSVVDDGAALAVGELVGVIVERLARIERNAHEARLGERVIHDQTVDAVRHQHADAIAGLKPSASSALPSRSVSASNSRKLTTRVAFDEAGASPK